MRLNRHIYLGTWVTDFVQYLLDYDASTTLLIVCSTREAFLNQLLVITRVHSRETAESHPILTKSLGLLSNSTRFKIAYCPTLENLRAYLSVLPLSGNSAQKTVAEYQEMRRPLMAILDLVTFATAVEAASREGMDLVLCECQDAANPVDGERGEVLWYTNIPLLNNSVRRGESTWLGRSVPVNRVVQRWFQFNEPNHSAMDM
ncbi:uncharacterized protein BDW43DRAFT_100743 [Aspergillus alliaceus]|uniref:uncharacterized protein n=1 Tax=Petromyces alliaceus TaxID=209559 RepID=UPI0012A5B6AA|nr:uncharacterized protein BDW43DRAFT_100743 [Aspergillus alliaceus]KAB8233000.1 hypothetical protein BDW43DRAFT_100743 [Aspergillus alliaceus]